MADLATHLDTFGRAACGEHRVGRRLAELPDVDCGRCKATRAHRRALMAAVDRRLAADTLRWMARRAA